MIDWEWANGSDPVENSAFWSYWNHDTSYLDILLDAYQPHNPPDFRKRVVRYEIVCAIDLAHVYTDIGKTSGIEQTKEYWKENYEKNAGNNWSTFRFRCLN